MLSTIATARKEREQGFTLIELLVVIIIIGILAAIAVPVYVNQKGRAQDAAVTSGVKSYVNAAESVLTNSGGTVSSVAAANTFNAATTGANAGNGSATDFQLPATQATNGTATLGINTNLLYREGGRSSTGVYIKVVATATPTVNGYIVCGYTESGKAYKNTTSLLKYDSTTGTLEPAASC